MFERTFSRCMGLAADGDGLWLSTSISSGRSRTRSQRLRRTTVTTASTCRASATRPAISTSTMSPPTDRGGSSSAIPCSAASPRSASGSFVPLWKPPFISKLAAEDRCHLNGLAMDGGQPAYVTAVGRSDVTDAWRDHRRAGGIVIDVASGEIVVEGLSMPHSPRLYRGTLWLLDSGTGFFGSVDVASGRFEPLTFCPGYLRGLAFCGDFAVIGLSRARENRTFSGLALDDNLAARHAEPRCGLMVIDMRSGDIVHWLRFEGAVEELYDVAVLPGVIRPMALGFKTDEIRRVITVGDGPGTITR
ncbi:MAG: TIGR03032 family protein [Hyphomicrobiales bacterium]